MPVEPDHSQIERRGASEAPVSVERDIGRIEGALKAHEDRMDKTDDAIKALENSVNNRFDGVKLHLDKQDEKLDVLIRQGEREAGADGAKKIIFDNSLASWTKLAAAATVVGVGGDLLGKSILSIATRVITGH